MASREFYGSLLGHRPPFGQIHGHTSGYDWGRRRWRDEISGWARDATADPDRRQSTVWLSGRPFFGIDPGYGDSTPGRQIVALQLRGTVALG